MINHFTNQLWIIIWTLGVILFSLLAWGLDFEDICGPWAGSRIISKTGVFRRKAYVCKIF